MKNDQLVIVEPEGSGGGSGDFKLARCTLEGFSDAVKPVGELFVYVLDDKMYIGIDETLTDGIQIVLYGQTPEEISVSDVENCTFSGDCVFTPRPSGGKLTVTGDFTITYNGGGE